MKAVCDCCEAKARVVEQDEKEAGRRALLNLGHTFGHAIENATGYSTWLHGEAVGAGLVMAADLSRRRGHFDAADVERVRALVDSAGLPTDAQGLTVDEVLAAMGHDKKFEHGRRRFILLREPGRAFVADDVEPAMLADCLGAFCA